MKNANNLNPFDGIYTELSEIKSLLLVQANSKRAEPEIKPDFDKIPIQEIFKKKYLSKPTFYDHVRSGRIKLYKLGSRSFVDRNEFNAAFEKVILTNPKEDLI